MDPVRNPYAPGAGQRPPELAGRDREIGQFEVVLERVARGRPERSMVLTGLRGVGKTVPLNSFRSMAMQRLWGTGKLEARPDQSIRRPVAGALHMAVRELAPRHRAPDRIDHFLGVLKAFAARDSRAPKGSIVTQLGKYGPVKRIGGRDPASSSVAFATYPDPACAFGQGLELGPGDGGMDSRPGAGDRTEAAVGAGDDVLTPDDLRVAVDALSDQVGVLDDVG